MLFENNENSNKKPKNTQTAVFPSVDETTLFDGLGDSSSAGNSSITPQWDAMKKRTTQKLDYLSAPVSGKATENRFKDSFANFMVIRINAES